MLTRQTKLLLLPSRQLARPDRNDAVTIICRIEQFFPQPVGIDIVIMQEDLLRDPTSDDSEVRARVTAWEVVAASYFEVGLFY